MVSVVGEMLARCLTSIMNRSPCRSGLSKLFRDVQLLENAIQMPAKSCIFGWLGCWVCRFSHPLVFVNFPPFFPSRPSLTLDALIHDLSLGGQHESSSLCQQCFLAFSTFFSFPIHSGADLIRLPLELPPSSMTFLQSKKLNE